MTDTNLEQTPPAAANSALDQIEAEAAAITSQPAANEPQQAEPAAQPIPDSAFEATADMAIVGIKKGLERFDGGEAAAAVWDAPIFKQSLVPVLKKYNISILSLPPEIVLLGVVAMLAFDSATKIKEARDAKAAQKQES